MKLPFPRNLRKYLIVPLTLLGAYLYRLRGGGPGPKLPRPLDQILFSSFPCLVLPLSYIDIGLNWHTGAIFAGFVWAVAWECSGHGGFMDLATWMESRRDETIEFLIEPLRGKISEYWYDVLGLALTGLIVTILPGIILSFANPWAGLSLALSGAIKAPGYMAGWKLFKGTEAGEWISGGLRWGIAALIRSFL